jgi:hypothetical protein
MTILEALKVRQRVHQLVNIPLHVCYMSIVQSVLKKRTSYNSPTVQYIKSTVYTRTHRCIIECNIFG